MACGTHLSCGIPIERCRPQSEVGARAKGKEVLGRIGGFWLLLLLGKTTKSRHPHRQRLRQNFSALGTHLPGHKGTEVCWALAPTLRTGRIGKSNGIFAPVSAGAHPRSPHRPDAVSPRCPAALAYARVGSLAWSGSTSHGGCSAYSFPCLFACLIFTEVWSLLLYICTV